MKFLQAGLRFLDGLTRPPSALTDLYQRRQVRAMAILLVSMFVILFLSGADWLTTDFSPIVPLILFSAGAMIVGLYFVNRRGNYHAASWVLVIFIAAISYILLLDRPIDALSLTYQVIAVLIVGVFMSLRMTIIVSLLVIAGTLVISNVATLPLTHDQLAPVQQAVIALVVIIMLNAWHREQLNDLRRKEVERSEKRYRIISDLLSDFAFAFDATEADPPLEWITDAVLPTTGYGADELKHVSDCDRMVHPDDLPKLRAQRRSMFARQPFGVEQFRIFHKTDQRTVWLSIKLYPEWEGGKVVRVYAACSDITEQMRLKEEVSEKELLRAQLNKEQEMSDSRNKFMSMMSHEFRTPLAVILSTSEMLDKYHERMNETRRHELLERIITQVTQLAATMDDLSLLVQMQSGKLLFRPVPTDFAALVRRWVDDIRASVGANHNFDFTIEGNLSDIDVDERLLTIVVNNLLSNAVKYSQPDTEIAVRLRREDDRLTLKITDHGIGIPGDDIQKLYQPYFRASNVGSVVGTGLGLRTVKECVELHGGTLTIESVVDVGTTVTVELPAHHVKA